MGRKKSLSIIIDSLVKGERTKFPIVVILDEFASLGDSGKEFLHGIIINALGLGGHLVTAIGIHECVNCLGKSMKFIRCELGWYFFLVDIDVLDIFFGGLGRFSNSLSEAMTFFLDRLESRNERTEARNNLTETANANAFDCFNGMFDHGSVTGIEIIILSETGDLHDCLL